VLGEGRADVFIPGQDAPGPGWPSNLDDVARELAKGQGDGGDGGLDI
jgi:hypothetical protein